MNADELKENLAKQTRIEYDDDQIERILQNKVTLRIIFDADNLSKEEFSDLMRSSNSFNSMISAANAAADLGWEFFNSDIVVDGRMKTHYYYMKRKKNR